MAKYVYPAIFTSEDSGGYSVSFPDFESCYTCGDDMAEALAMAEDVLCLTLYDMEQEGKQAPTPSAIKAIVTDEKSIVSLVRCDTEFYRQFYSKKLIKKTLNIPEWLNQQAVQANAPFSQILQEGLKAYLHISA